MAKPELGQKRTCQSCSAKFYDMNRAPIVCPKCGASFDPEALMKLRRGRPVPAPVPKPVPANEPEPAEAEEADGEDTEDEEEDEAVMEDTSELGQDSDDVDEVVDKTAEDGESR